MKNHASHSATPVYVLQETPEDFKIAYDMKSTGDSHMELLLSEDKRRLHVLGKRFLPNFVDEFLWSFELPTSVESENIEFIQRQDFYLISIPKKKFFSSFHRESHTKPYLQFASAI